MGLGLTVPLMLITKAENGRQHNLAIGLGIVLVTGFISAGVAVVNKIAIDAAVPIFGTVLYTSLGILCTTVFIIVLKNGVRSVLMHIKNDTTPLLVFYSSLRASLISLSLFAMLYAYTQGGTLAVVQTVHSMYILIPIVLAIVFYNEHWNIQKVIAIILSVAALAFLQ